MRFKKISTLGIVSFLSATTIFTNEVSAFNSLVMNQNTIIENSDVDTDSLSRE